MIKTFLSLWFVCFALTASSQGTLPRQHHIYLQFGTAVPLANIDEFVGIRVKGMIKTGYMAKIGYARDIRRHFSLGASFVGSLHRFDSEAIARAADGTVEIAPWKSTFLLADAYLKLPLKKLTVYGKGSFGLMFPQTWSLTAVSGQYTGTLRTIESTAVAYGAGLGVSYTLGKFEVGFETDALTSRPELQFEHENTTINQRQLIGTHNNTLRLGLMF